MHRIALLEDHDRVAQLIETSLSRAGIQVDRFANLSEARYGLARADYAAMIVDRGLPDGDGIHWIRALRAAGNMTPCLMLTARDAVHDRIDGLESGADDYLTKPFSTDELVARIRALMRRPAVIAPSRPSLGDLILDPMAALLHRGDDMVSLAPAELQIMLCLIAAQGGVVRHASLEHAAWGVGGAVTPNALDVALHRLRKKITAIESTVQLTNARGRGYALTPTPIPDLTQP